MLWKSKHAQVEELLRTLISAGEWLDELPGYRILEKQMQVGRGALEKALAKLTEEGILSEPEAGARRRILARPSADAPKPAGKALLMVGVEAFHELNWDNRQHLAHMTDAAQEHGWRVAYDHFDFVCLQNPAAPLERLMKNHSPDRVLLVMPTLHVVRWFQARKIPLFCIGGAITRYGHEFDGAITTLTETHRLGCMHLAEQGHRRILITVSPLHIPSKEEFIDAALATWATEHTREEVASLIRFHEVHTPAAMQQNWRKWLAELEPTAVMVSNIRELLSLLGFCSKIGIRVPADLSIVSGMWDPMLQWLHPGFTAVHRANPDIERWALSWLLSPLSKPQGLRRFTPSLGTGNTVAAPRITR